MTKASNMTNVVKSLAFWACFWLILFGLQHLPLSSLGGAGVFGCLAIVATLILIFGFLRVDGGLHRDIGLRFTSKNLLHFFLGTCLGVLLVAGMISALIVFTPIEISASADSDILAVLTSLFLVLLVLALMEELAFRSYPLFRLREAWGIRASIYISSLAFAFYHGLAVDNLLGPGVWGLFFGWMAISTNSIALPTGFHLGLNWLQALVGLKPQYGGSIWELSITSGPGLVGVETLGMLMQVILLVVGIVMVENLARKRISASE